MSDKHIPRDLIEKAIVVYDALGRGQTLDERTIAKAFHQIGIAAHREGMKRAAEIALHELTDKQGLLNTGVIVRRAILSEAGES